MTDADGRTVWAASYTPYGTADVIVDEVPLPLRLPGQYADAETGTHHNHHRDYDPTLGRYLSSDPLGPDGGTNGYAYADGNPLQLADPLGLSTDPTLRARAVPKPEADFASRLDHVVALAVARFAESGTSDLIDGTLEELRQTATVIAGIAAAAGVVVGGAAVASGGAAIPATIATLATAASAVGVVSLWMAGAEGVNFIYQLVRIGLDVYRTEHTDCRGLKALSDRLYERVVGTAPAVLSDVATVGLGRVANKLHDVFRLPARHGSCSFAGETLVPTRTGRRAIRDIVPGRDEVWARDERTGKTGWKAVLARYDNRYAETVRVTARDAAGALQTIRSNRIHPFFARVAAGALLAVAAEGHVYAGDIPGGAWVDAQHLAAGDRLLDGEGGWQEVVSVTVAEEPLRAFNLSVEGFSTYHVAGGAGARAVWVHNRCFGELPDGFREIEETTDFGHKLYRAPNGERLYRAWDAETEAYRFYEVNKHPPSRGGIRYVKKPQDIDWRGTDKTFQEAIEEAFRQTGISKSEFTVRLWGRDRNGKSFPVEWRGPNGAEVSVDYAHDSEAPDVPHVGWQTGGKKRYNGKVVGHILLGSVPYGRGAKDEVAR